MTENEAIKRIKECMNTPNFQPYHYMNEALEMAIQSLEEIQQYEAIGTVEEFKAYKNGDCMNDCEHYDNCANYIYSKGYNRAIDEFASELENHSICADTGKGYEVKMEWVSPVTRIKEIAEQMKAGVS